MNTEKVNQPGKVRLYWRNSLRLLSRFYFPRTKILEQELSSLIVAHQSLMAELERIRTKSESESIRDRKQSVIHEKRITSLEFEHNKANQQLHVLNTLLNEASRQQKYTATQVNELANKLKEASSNHQASLESIQNRLTQVQTNQQSFLALHSDIIESLENEKSNLKEVIQDVSTKSHKHVLAISLIALFVLINTVAATASIWAARQEIQDLSIVTKQLKLSLTNHFKDHKVASLTEPPEKYDRNVMTTRKSIAMDSDPLSMMVYEAHDDKAFVYAKPSTVKHNEFIANAPYERTSKMSPTIKLKRTDDYNQISAKIFDPHIKELQIDLLALGFNLGLGGADGLNGTHTMAALQEFELLYQPIYAKQQDKDSNNLSKYIKRFADLAREDERKYRVNSEVLAAIRLSALRTGVNFSFLMQLAEIESTFNTRSQSTSSSAAGLYQFKDDTWLEIVKRHGKKYGLGEYASQVDFFIDGSGNRRPMISDPLTFNHAMNLRHNPRISALMAAEYIKGNIKQLSQSTEHNIGSTEMYLTHFLGLSGAITFLDFLTNNPDKVAEDIFPGPASRNHNIFRYKSRKQRTIAEVYDLLDSKINSTTYPDWLN